MKATTRIGFGLLGLATLLVGLNFFLPNLLSTEKLQVSSPSVSATLRPRLRFDDPAPNTLAQAQETDPPVPLPTIATHPRYQALRKHPKASTPAAVVMTPLPAPSFLASSPSPRAALPVKTTTPLPVQPLVSTSQQHKVVHHRKLPALTKYDLIRFRRLRHAAELDAVRRTAIGAVRNLRLGTTVSSSDIQELVHGLYRVVLVEQTSRGTVVEYLHLQHALGGGFLVTKRHTISSTTSDPFVGEPTKR